MGKRSYLHFSFKLYKSYYINFSFTFYTILSRCNVFARLFLFFSDFSKESVLGNSNIMHLYEARI